MYYNVKDTPSYNRSLIESITNITILFKIVENADAHQVADRIAYQQTTLANNVRSLHAEGYSARTVAFMLGTDILGILREQATVDMVVKSGGTLVVIDMDGDEGLSISSSH